MMAETILCLPLPQHLDGVDSTPRPDAARRALGALFDGAPTRDPRLLIERLEAPARAIVARWRTAVESGAAPGSGSERHQEYEAYFGVQRLAGGDPLASLGEAALVAYHRLLLDSLRGCSLGSVELSLLQGTFEEIAATLGGAPDPSLAEPVVPGSWAGARSEAPVDAMVRWKLGHQAFFVLIQASIAAHTQLAVALRERQHRPAAEALSLATRLWWGTAAAFRYTGDFSADDYERVVRPSMSPPAMKHGFSGLLSVDHAYLLRAVKALRPALQELPEELGREHRLYLQALDAAYEAHAFVCERFVGCAQSLKGSHQDPQASAPTILRREFKSRALRNAGGPTDP